MTYGEWSDNFQWSFPGGRFDSYNNLNGQVVQFKGLRVTADAKPIQLATVVYGQNGKTWVIDESTNEVQTFRPFTENEYLVWKEKQRDKK